MSDALWSSLRQVLRPARPKIVLRRLVTAVLRIPGLACAGVYLLDTERKAYVLAQSHRLPPDFKQAVRSVGTDSVLGRALHRGRVIVRDHAAVRAHPLYAAAGFRSIAAVPILHDGQVVASLNVASKTLDRLPGATLRLVETMAARLATLLAHMRAHRAAEEATAEMKGFRRMIERGPAVAVVSGPPPEHAAEFVSENIRRFGYRASDLVAQKTPLVDLVHPDDRRRVLRALAVASHSARRAGRMEFRIVTARGTSRWVEVHFRPRARAAGRPAGFQGTLLDITGRRDAEESSRIADRRFRQIAELVQDVFWVARIPQWEWLYCSPAARDLLGRTPEQLRTRADWEAACHPDDVRLLRTCLRNAGRGDSAPALLRMRHTDGSLRWVEMRGYVVRDPLTQARRVAGTTRDLTSHVLVRDELKRRIAAEVMTQRLARHFVTGPGSSAAASLRWALGEIGRFMALDRVVMRGYVTARSAFNTLAWSRAGIPRFRARKAAGLSSRHGWVRSQLREGRTVAVRSLADLPAEAADTRAECEADGTRSILFLPLIHRRNLAGSLALVMSRAERAWSREDVRLGRTAGDILANALVSQRAEDALLAERRRLLTIVEQAGDAILLLDPSGRILDVNRAGCAMLQMPKRRLRGKPVGRLLPRHGEVLAAGRLSAAAGGAAVTTDELRRPGGRVLAAETRARRLPGGDIMAIVRDVTERRRREHSMLALASRERQRVGRDLHDTIGQQLGGLSFLAHAVQHRLAARGAPEAKTLEHICGQLGRTLAHTRHIAHGLAPMWAEEGGLLHALRRLAEDTARTYEIACEFTPVLRHRLRSAEVEQHLYHVASEAVHNAVRHSGARRLAIRLSVDKARGGLTVSDDGAWKTSGRGAEGIGLRLMRHRAELMGGELSIERNAADGKGTRLRCTFLNRSPPASN